MALLRNILALITKPRLSMAYNVGFFDL